MKHATHKREVFVDGTDRLSRNVGKELQLYAASYPRRVQIPLTELYVSQSGHEITRYRADARTQIATICLTLRAL
jgi:hypothetical protein